MHFAYLVLAGLSGLLVLLIVEYGWDKKWWIGEKARKIAHILIGCMVATWPFYLDWYEIRLISIALVIGIILSMRLKLFRSISAVSRVSYGELLFALAIGFITVITDSASVYALAILHLTVADGLAALIGVQYGKNSQYRIFGQTKSLHGTLSFTVTSLAIFVTYALLVPGAVGIQWVVMGVIGATLIENLGIYGLDNILVPVYVALLVKSTGLS